MSTIRRRKDFVARLAERRTQAVTAFCTADPGCKAKGFEAQVKYIAKIAVVTPQRIKSVCGGRADLGRQATWKLQNHLDQLGVKIAEHTENKFVQNQGVWIFADPKAKEIFMPLAWREDRIEVVRGLMIEYARATRGKKQTIEQAIAAIAEDTGLEETSIGLLARSVSHLGQERLGMLKSKFGAAGADPEALNLLGEDPRSWNPNDISEQSETAPVDVEDDESDTSLIQQPSTVLQNLGVLLTTLGGHDHLLISGSGNNEPLSGDQDYLIVLRRGVPPQIISPPAGAGFNAGQLLKGTNADSGMVSVPFEARPGKTTS